MPKHPRSAIACLAGAALWTIASFALSAGESVYARGRVFGIVAKSVIDPNFISVWEACVDEARKTGDSCRLLGPPGPSSARLQARAVSRALRSGEFDALAISVTSSPLIAATIEDAQIPIISFDSPFESDDAPEVRAFLGPDNYRFGLALAHLVQRLRPSGGVLCLMSDSHDPNLAQRVLAIRRTLSGQPSRPRGQRLRNERGWTEHARCPWQVADNPRRAVDQFAFTVSALRPDVFVSVGHWPVMDERHLLEVLPSIRAPLESRRTLAVVALGHIPSVVGSMIQRGLLHGYAAFDFSLLGRASAVRMRALVEHSPTPRFEFPIRSVYSPPFACGGLEERVY